MKNRQYINLKTTLLSIFALLAIVSCEREYSDNIEFATHSETPGIFIDGFVGGLDYFPFGGSYAEAFSVDTNESYNGSASMRFDIPSFGVGYGGATFPSLGPRDLSNYDALTFWAKASQGADINEIGFGINEDTADKYKVSIQNLAISTQWKKYVIPIPDASKLIEEKGMFWYAEGAENENDEGGYTFWIDELKFEKLGNIAQAKPAILGGVEVNEQVFTGGEINLADRGLTQTLNLGSGINQTVSAAPSYFTFESSDIEVARISELGIVSIVGEGTATITASIAGIKAQGSLNIETIGDFKFAPTPTLDPINVTSVFSDAYSNVAVDFLNGYWEPWQTTLSDEINLNGDNLIKYSEFNFVGNQFAPIDASNKSTLHVNMFIIGTIPTNLDFLITVKDFGADGVDGGGDDTTEQFFFNGANFVEGEWSSLELPITMQNKNNVGQIIYENINGSSLSSFYLDNIYFHN